MSADVAETDRPWLGQFAYATRLVSLNGLDRINTCIATTRIGLMVLAHYGVQARVQPVFVGVYNHEAWGLVQREVPFPEWPDSAYSLGINERSVVPGGDGWNGHLVLVVRLPGEPRILVDLTADQFARPQHGIEFHGPILMGIASAWTPVDPLSALSGDEQPSVISYRPMPPGHPETNRWRTSIDWTGYPEEFEKAAAAVIERLDQPGA